LAKASRANGGKREASDSTVATEWRAPTADFSSSLRALQDAVRKACAGQSEWEAKIAAGIRATLDFAALEPAAVHALTIDAQRQTSTFGDRQQEVIAYFAGLLAEVAPTGARHQISSDESIVESIALIVRGHLLSGKADQLPLLAPDIVYLILMPYAGIAAAKHWADPFALVETQ
jgi:hypothetical protein